jgi:hypothetical protein
MSLLGLFSCPGYGQGNPFRWVLAHGLWLLTPVVWSAPSWELFAAGEGVYTYAPCAIEDGVHHFWWCQNAEPRQIVDHIYYRRYEFAGNRWTPLELALAPGARGQWDSVHVCDPSIVRGQFHDGATQYGWLLAYLGCDTTTNRHNQVGLAFAVAPGGPWVRCRTNPVVQGLASTWGVGQPALVSLDQRGRVALFYTRQEQDLSTHTWLTEVDLSEASAPRLSPAVRIATAGLTERGQNGPVLHDADFALDADCMQLYAVRPLAASDLNRPGQPVRLPSVVQVARGDWGALRVGGGQWTVVAEIGPEQTGFAFGHSPAFGRDPYGRLLPAPRLRLNLAVASRLPDPLWTYTLHGVLVDLP